LASVTVTFKTPPVLIPLTVGLVVLTVRLMSKKVMENKVIESNEMEKAFAA